MKKIKIAIDIQDIWENQGDFREVFKDISLDIENYTLYIVTRSQDNDLVESVKSLLGIEDTNVFQSQDNSLIQAKLTTYGIDIFMTGDNELVTLVNETTTRAILTNMIPDRFNMQGMWLTNLNFWIKQILKDSDEKKENC